MAKKEADGPDGKLQIPVSRELADELARWAKEIEWTQGHLAAVLLEFGTDDRAKIGRWLAKRAATCTRPGSGPGWLQKGDNSAVRLQVSVKPRIASRIEKLANALNQTTVRMAALLLDFAVCDEKWAMQLLKSRVGKAISKMLGKKSEQYESAEISEIDNGINP
jgi:hypothetical protein